MADGSISANTTSVHTDLRWGWVQSGQDRGTLDILWSCSVTIVLCCWVATHPNVSAPKDKFLQRWIDKTHLAMIGLLGPDFLFGIALGQFSSARRSVKKFKTEKVPCDGQKWTYTYAFFADMGGMFLTSTDFPEGFPINAEQLHWLIKYGHVDFPNMEQMNIGERNASDTLSRLLVIWQALWFSVIEIQRTNVGLPMTTLELTALSYVFVMLATQICWFKKPSISSPRTIPTKDDKLVEDIRAWARGNTHRELPEEWYRTPLDFIDGPRFQIATHWSYYTRLLHLLRLPIISRPMNCKPWDRFPSDMWIPAEKSWLLAPFAGFVLVVFSGWFLIGWNFFFPSPVEQYMWRVCAVTQAAFGIYGGVYYMLEGFKWHAAHDKLEKQMPAATVTTTSTSTTKTTSETKDASTASTLLVLPDRVDVESQTHIETTTNQVLTFRQRWRRILPRYVEVRLDHFLRTYRKFNRRFDAIRNISSDQDPQMALPLHVIIPVTIVCAIYTLCRAYVYIEDYISLRVQPVGVYMTVNRYVPFWGDG
ncbi:hypothetical protein B0T16DRAFT_407361 [Cercophora newfieldiana]|uniref:Uncharacterized protein n=1 Tax=Cercophora newfieldiana TaxID=92897 RepID=A0AA39YI80_9PEZI|nr:hypothetical protein B0T16DRAFT_407361 [Cercophora newfieldiana]